MLFTLLFLPSGREGHRLGFKPDGVHQLDPELRAWWPGHDIRMLQFPIERVLIPDSVYSLRQSDEKAYRDLNDAMQFVRPRLQGRKLWMEL